MKEDFESEGNVYGSSEREELVDNDEISPEEEGFMKGYDEADSDELEDDDEDSLD